VLLVLSEFIGKVVVVQYEFLFQEMKALIDFI
jgi:hypothetical protein